jgi:hypothetical protein
MNDQQKKIAAGAGFAAVAALILFFELRDPATVAAPAAPVVTTLPSAGTATGRTGSAGGAARHLGTAPTELDPTLRMGPMLVTEGLVYSGTGRNIFSAVSAPVALPKPIASARPKPVVPVVLPPPGPPPPPPIDLKFFGTATSGSGRRQAFLLRGEDVFLAAAGDVVQRRYKVIAVAANSIVVEDMANSNRQTLPLLVR